MNLQSKLISLNTCNQEEIKSVIRVMKAEIVNHVGSELQEEVSTLLEKLSEMTEIIQTNFS